MRSEAETRRGLIADVLNQSSVCDCYTTMKASLERINENVETLISHEIELLSQELNLMEDV